MKPEEATVSMQQIADAAHVTRQAVTQWRTRGADPNHGTPAFPTPVGAPRSPRFRLEQVREWFRSSGAGNHTDVVADLPLHSSLMEELSSRPEQSSALLVLASVLGSPLAPELAGAVDRLGEGLVHRGELPAMLREVLELPGAAELLREDLSAACLDADLVETVDAVVEAAYEAPVVLRRLHGLLRQEMARGVSETATMQLRTLIGMILEEIAGALRVLSPEQQRVAVVPRSAEAVSLLAELSVSETEGQPNPAWMPARLVGQDSLAQNRAQPQGARLVAWRLLLAHQQGLETVDLDAPASEVPVHLHFGSWLSPSAADAARFFDWVQELVDDLPQEGAVLVLGPAQLMLDAFTGPLERRRRDLLIRAGAAGGVRVDTLLRWAAALPTRLVGHGGRQPLALWLFAVDPENGPAADATLFCAYHDLNAPGAAATAASDAAACVLGAEQMRRHGFASGRPVSWHRFLTQGVLRLPVTAPAPAMGRVGELLARVEHTAAAAELTLPEGMELRPAQGAADAGAEARVRFIPWPAVVQPRNPEDRLARVLKGHRIPVDLIGEGQAHAMRVVGVPELTALSAGEEPAVDRTIERLDAVASIARLRETEPGDVIFSASPHPMAWVDRDGGSVVEAPARILRPRPKPGRRADPRVWGENTEGPQITLVPEALAGDIRAQSVGETQSWRVRVFPRAQGPQVQAFSRSVASRRRDLREQLQALEQAEWAVFDGASAGLLEITGTTQTAESPRGSPG